MPTVRTYEAQQQTKPLPDVRRSGLPVAQLQTSILTAQPNAAAFGAVAGENIRQFGEQRFSQELQYQDELHQKAKAQQDRVRILEADRMLSEWENHTLYDPENGALNKRGKDAFGLPESISQDFEKAYGEIWQGLANDEQRQTFDQLANTRRSDVQQTVLRHVSGQLRDFEAKEQTQYLQNSREAAAANANDPMRVGTEIQRTRIAVSSFAKANGLGPEYTKAETAKAVSQIHVDVMNRLLAGGQDLNAKDYYDHNKDDILGTDRAPIESNLHEGSLRGESQRQADRIMQGYVTGMVEQGNIDLVNRPRVKNADGSVSTIRSITIEEDGQHVIIPTVSHDGRILSDDQAVAYFHKTGEHLGIFDNAEAADRYAGTLHERQARMESGGSPYMNQTEAMDEAKKITDPEVRDQVAQRVAGEWTMRKQQARENEEATAAQSKDVLDQTMKQMLNLIDTRKPVFARDVIPPNVWNESSVQQREAFETYAKRYQENGGKIDTDRAHWYMLLDEADKNPKAFADRNLMLSSPKLSDSDFQEMGKLQKTVRDGKQQDVDKQLDGFRTNTQILDDTLTLAGIDVKAADPKDLARVRSMVDEQVDTLQRQTGKKATNADIQNIVDQLLTTVTVPGSEFSLLGIFPSFRMGDVQKRLFQVGPDENVEFTAVNPKTGEKLVHRNGQWVKP